MPPLAATAPAASERLLLDLARRLERTPSGCVALVLHLARMPAARPHHRRIARAMLQDAAQRQDGQVFALRNGDLVLLCRPPPRPRGGRARAPAAAVDIDMLPATLERLMHADVPEAPSLVSRWPIEQEPGRLVAYASERLAETIAAPPREGEPPSQVGAIGVLAGLAADPSAVDLLHRQTAAVLMPARPRPDAAGDGGALRPVFTEVGFSMAALEARAGLALMAESDPFLFRHLAAQLDPRLLEMVAAAIGTDGPLDPLGQRHGVPTMHLNLALSTLLSDGFAGLVAATGAAGVGLGVELAFGDVVADPDGFAHARASLAEAGVTLVLDGISHMAMTLSQPWTLGADLLKLDWSARMPGLVGDEAARLQSALRRCGTHRILLHRADSESAIRWGLAHGIRRFQGRHIDAMLAAARIIACPRADACTLRQCVERAVALSPAGRSQCRNTALLDEAAP